METWIKITYKTKYGGLGCIKFYNKEPINEFEKSCKLYEKVLKKLENQEKKKLIYDLKIEGDII